MNKLLRMALILTSFQNPDALNLHHSGYVRSLSGTVAASSVKLDSTLRTGSRDSNSNLVFPRDLHSRSYPMNRVRK